MKREIPQFQVLFTKQRYCPYALVIPVINEGERILSLLGKIFQSSYHDLLDIIIVDGGSTDGSLEFERLKSLGVHSLLLKTDSGKLSAQLRCAYAYALDAGYEGIITIDGNNKDDPQTLPLFIQKLNEGYDFVQASRFIEGGVAVNTPKSRDLAIRYIHAQLLSFASGFHWTDTTQGYRAYSRKLLADSRVNIFRAVFSGYELLAYLSYIAPKLGFKCIEVPSSRIYPKGQVPTKISSFKGNLELLKVLFTASLGGYNNREN